jgi:hypothetical protein
MLTGTDNTTGETITGQGYTLFDSPAPAGPGSSGGNATFTTSLDADSWSVNANGSSTSSSLVLMQTLAVYFCDGTVDTETASCGGNGEYLGTLTREQQ